MGSNTKEFDIGVVTFFDAYNYGAALQTFALQFYLEKNDIKSCIVRFPWQEKEKIRSIKSLIYYLMHNRKESKKKQSFRKFLSSCKYINISNDINEKCESFIVGSDQVWNPKWNNEKCIFFLDFANNKYSYAASFGNINNIEGYQYKLVKKYLSNFNIVSVRESNAVPFLDKMGIKAQTNIDPVFLLDKEEWSSYCNNKYNFDYVLVYSLENNPSLNKLALDIGRKFNYRVLAIVDTLKKRWNEMETVSYSSPNDFLTLFKNAKYIVTNSYHGTAFSIIFRKPFYVFMQNDINAPNDRLLTLLSAFKLDKRIVSDTSFNSFETDIKYDYYENIVTKERGRTKSLFDDICNKRVLNINHNQNISFYYAKSKNIIDIERSRSGGIAYLLSRYCFENNYSVYGAAIEEKEVIIKKITDYDDIETTRNSKYVFSNVKNTYINVKNDLANNKKVLYIALPCQIFALKQYLINNKINISNLLTIDMVCHGAPKPIYFKRYIEYLEEKYHGKVVDFNFRNKKFGWNSHIETFSVGGKEHKKKDYTHFFYSNYGLRNQCYVCPHTSFNNVSNITLMDAWGYVDSKDIKSGANLIIINDSVGLNILNKIESQLCIKELKYLSFVQPNIKGPSAKPVDLDYFNSLVNKQNIKQIFKYASKNVVKLERINKIKGLLIKIIRFYKK